MKLEQIASLAVKPVNSREGCVEPTFTQQALSLARIVEFSAVGIGKKVTDSQMLAKNISRLLNLSSLTLAVTPREYGMSMGVWEFSA